MRLILASGSQSRRSILESAGVPFEIIPADVDESVLKSAFEGSPQALAMHLAEAKALDVSCRNKGLVIGADQVLDLDGRIYDKATSIDDAREKLKDLRGRKHVLRGGLVVAEGETILWRHESACVMDVRDFSDAFLETYIQTAGSILTKGVGAYAFEGLGAQIFEAVDGNFHAILGLDLLPLLGFLRSKGVISV